MSRTGEDRRDLLSISLGFEETDQKDVKKRQSLWRIWKRLSSLQRSVICLVLVLGGLSALYILPTIHSGRHVAADDSLLGRRDRHIHPLAGGGDRGGPGMADPRIQKNVNFPVEDHLQINQHERRKNLNKKELERIAQQQLNIVNKRLNKKGPPRSFHHRINPPEQPVIDKPPNGGGDEQGLLPPDEKQDQLERDENGDGNGRDDDNEKDDNVDGQINVPKKTGDQDFQVEQKDLDTYNYFDPNRRITQKQKAVVDAFKFAWAGYKKYAWGHDEYHPVSKTHSEWFGVGLTILDSLDTVVIMGLKEEYDEAKEWVEEKLTFNKDRDVNLFEITIRVLGGLLSVYHLTGDEIFKTKAMDLGDRLLPCFNSPSSVPFSDVNLMTGRAHAPKWGPDSSTSEVTTIQLEFRDLSRVTKNAKYEKAVDRVSQHVHSLPKKDGLVPIFINANTGQFRGTSTITVGARGDSYYEYLLKQWVQTGKTQDMYKTDFIAAIDGMKTHLLKESVPSRLLYVGELLGSRTFSPKMDHLVCFLPGTLALGYKNGLPAEHLELAKKLTKTCFEMYNRMPTKLSPEIVYFSQASGAKEDLIVKAPDAHNLLRPETVESLVYLYRITGDKMYQDWGWIIFKAFMKHTKVDRAGFSSIHNVKNLGNPGFRDKLESFFLAETLKYFYLLFSDDSSLLPFDKFVFNSEAHPLPIYST